MDDSKKVEYLTKKVEYLTKEATNNNRAFLAILIGGPVTFMLLTWQPIYIIVLFFFGVCALMGYFSGKQKEW